MFEQGIKGREVGGYHPGGELYAKAVSAEIENRIIVLGLLRRMWLYYLQRRPSNLCRELLGR